jgi:hypothetical protein
LIAYGKGMKISDNAVRLGAISNDRRS